MCGRFTLTASLAQLIDYFAQLEVDYEKSLDLHKPQYNIAPGHEVLGLARTQTGKNKLGYLYWGLKPSWSKANAPSKKIINARIETLSEKPTFKKLLPKKRCLVVADGFYEWQRLDNEKIPHYIYPSQAPLFVMPALWDRYMEDGKETVGMAIVTTEACSKLSSLHTRMPVMISPEEAHLWLETEQSFCDTRTQLLEASADFSKDVVFHPVSKRVNKVANSGPSLIEPVKDRDA